ncbi:hypothetical protein C2S51_026840, partial [Perilla frutescens var. frutescens]
MNLPKLVNITLQNNKLQGPFPQFPSRVDATIGTTNSFCLDKPGPCDPQVTTLLSVAAALGYPMPMAESWEGNDACKAWRFVSCDTKGQSVTTVSMAKQGFSGSISPAFANLTSLRNLVLNDNDLSGVIPSEIITLPQLQMFDVSNNNLSGPIPIVPSSLKFVYAGNLLLGKNVSDGGSGVPGTNSGRASGSNKSPVSAGLIAGVVVAVVVFIGVVLFVSYKCYIRRRQKKAGGVEGIEQGKKTSKTYGTNGNAGGPSELHSRSSDDHSEFPLSDGGNVGISIEVLRQVTDNFSEQNVLGRGGFGVVYKGDLHDGTKIA